MVLARSLNGRFHDRSIDIHTLFLHALRDDLHILALSLSSTFPSHHTITPRHSVFLVLVSFISASKLGDT